MQYRTITHSVLLIRS